MIDIVKTETNTGFEFINGRYEVLCTIPNNATNGDIIKALFPYVNVKDSGTIYYSVNIEDLSSDKELNTVGFRKDWWNAPWKEHNKGRSIKNYE